MTAKEAYESDWDEFYRGWYEKAEPEIDSFRSVESMVKLAFRRGYESGGNRIWTRMRELLYPQ